ncbi:helix-turn-helix domain-containing protein [Neobacillus sp. D3-1R]|uniref:helix-turn-helix domain-containing protein n=1 Tax=Neobacillus sp. D3-1R TaxID=3445778 RepID=UPI003FA11C56
MIGTNIFKLRKKRGLSLSELSERAKISKSYLSNIERNLNKNPSIHILEKVAKGLNVEIKEIIKIDERHSINTQLDPEWIDFIQELMNSGIHKEQIHEYRTLIEFINWQKKKY